ncbi:MAG: hypothetical protein ACK5LT_00110 [Lachnospirales bacterium]
MFKLFTATIFATLVFTITPILASETITTTEVVGQGTEAITIDVGSSTELDVTIIESNNTANKLKSGNSIYKEVVVTYYVDNASKFIVPNKISHEVKSSGKIYYGDLPLKRYIKNSNTKVTARYSGYLGISDIPKILKFD